MMYVSSPLMPCGLKVLTTRLVQFFGRGGAVRRDGIFGRRLAHRCCNRDVHGRGADRCCVSRGVEKT